MVSKNSLLIVIVNWNSNNQLKDCLNSIIASDYDDCLMTVVVDNNSFDGSEACAQHLNESGYNIHLVRSRINIGFGNACNLGVEWCKSTGRQVDFILFLNPDTLLDKDTLRQLFEQPLILDSSVGIYGVQLVDTRGVTCTCSYFPTALNFWCKYTGLSRIIRKRKWAQHHMTNFDHKSSLPVDQVMGAFLLIREKVFQALGGFDPQFFVYFEEVDLCLRAQRAGYSVWFISEVKAWHRGNGTTENIKAFRLYLSISSRLRYFRKNRPFIEFILIFILSFVFEPVARAIHLMKAGRFVELKNILDGYCLFWKGGIR